MRRNSQITKNLSKEILDLLNNWETHNIDRGVINITNDTINKLPFQIFVDIDNVITEIKCFNIKYAMRDYSCYSHNKNSFLNDFISLTMLLTIPFSKKYSKYYVIFYNNNNFYNTTLSPDSLFFKSVNVNKRCNFMLINNNNLNKLKLKSKSFIGFENRYSFNEYQQDNIEMVVDSVCNRYFINTILKTYK